MKQGDTLSITLFNTAMDKVIKTSYVKGTKITESVQMKDYANYMEIIVRDKACVNASFSKIVHEPKKRGLELDDKKTTVIRNKSGNSIKPVMKGAEIWNIEFKLDIEPFFHIKNY